MQVLWRLGKLWCACVRFDCHARAFEQHNATCFGSDPPLLCHDLPYTLRCMCNNNNSQRHPRAQAYECSTLEASTRQESGHSDVGKLLAEAVAAADAVAITADEAEATAQGVGACCVVVWWRRVAVCMHAIGKWCLQSLPLQAWFASPWFALPWVTQSWLTSPWCTARKEKIRSNKKKVGIELEKPSFESGTIRIFDYSDRVPATSEAFHEALHALYAQHDAVLPATQTFEKAPLDLYAVFKLVAARGGYAAVTVHK